MFGHTSTPYDYKEYCIGNLLYFLCTVMCFCEVYVIMLANDIDNSIRYRYRGCF